MSSRRRLVRVAPGTAYTTGNNITYVGGATTFLPAFPCILEVEISISAPATLSKRITSAGSPVDMPLNNAVPIPANAVYTLLTIGDPLDTLAFRLDQSVTINEMYVHEVDGDVA